MLVCSLLGSCTYKNDNTEWCSVGANPGEHYLRRSGEKAITGGKWKPRISGSR